MGLMSPRRSKTDEIVALLTANRGSKKSDPTIAAAVEAFVEQERKSQKPASVRAIVSVLRGADRKTKDAKGTPLARTYLGQMKTGKVTVGDLNRFFNDRHRDLADSSRKRGMEHTGAFVRFCVKSGWMDRQMLNFITPIRVATKERPWLEPEVLAAIKREIEQSDDPRLDEYWRFSFYVDCETGLRPEEKQRLTPGSLNVKLRVLWVRGKGGGDGKLRKITVSDRFIAYWIEHIERYDIRPNQAMFFERKWESTRGLPGLAGEWIVESKARPCSEGAYLTMYGLITTFAQSLDWQLAVSFSLTPTVMRRTFACLHTIAHARHVPGALDPHQLQMQMGHESANTTQLYRSDVEEYLQRDQARPGTDGLLEDLLGLADD
jgi:integrase